MRRASTASLVLILLGIFTGLVSVIPASASEPTGPVSMAMPAEFATQSTVQGSDCLAVPDVVLPTLPVSRTLHDAAFEVGYDIGRPLYSGDYHPVVRTYEQSILLFVPTPLQVVPDGWLSPCEAWHAGVIYGACFGFHVERLDFELLLAMSGQLPCPTGAPMSAPPIALEAQYIASAATSRGIGLHQMLGRWDASHWGCLDELWTNESGWAVVKWNYAGSGAYGIPQALPGYKMSAKGSDWQTNAATQISWGLDYIAGRYGSPCQALYFKHGHGWY